MSENDDTSKFCSACGSALSPQCAATAPQQNEQAPRADTSSMTGDSSHHGRFLPGNKVAERYRIVSLVGRGGMGEVYRADDLKLGQTVALKFLPRDWDRDERRLEQFRNEVRLARSVAYPNVCRVYDIGEVDGQVFLSMECVDGEDLQSPLPVCAQSAVECGGRH
jgi:serine/threonine-protein kinase